jgi:CubicO group peptidase (beta-lactamase class C family)
MNAFNILHRLVGLLLVALVVTGCGSAPGVPTSVASGATPTASPSTALSAFQAEQIATFLEKLSTADLFSGVVLVAKDGTPLFARAYGLADKDANIPNQLDTKFNLGSLNKTFTAVAIAQLAEQGKLAFSDLVRTHLPAYPNPAVADTVTIEHLVRHTSGLGDFTYPSRADDAKLCCVSGYISLFADDPLAFPPGTRFQYSNAGYIVLGAIIEQASGQDYFDYVRTHIYAPAGMTNTDSFERDQEVANRAIGYLGRGATSRTVENTSTLPMKGGPDGGGYSTVEDLLKFERALRTHQLLSPEMTELLMRGTVDRGSTGSKAAFSFVDELHHGTRRVWNEGGVDGGNARFDMYPTTGHTIIILSNYTAPVDDMADKLGEIIIKGQAS